MFPSSGKQFKKFAKIFFFTWVLFNHFIRMYASHIPIGAGDDPSRVFPRSLGEALASVNQVRVMTGNGVHGLKEYCLGPDSVKSYCGVTLDGVNLILGLS